MSIEAKEAFINRIKTKLNDSLFPLEMEKLLDSINACLYGLKIELDSDIIEERSVYIGDDFLGIFINALKIQGRSKCTIENYSYAIKMLLDYIKTDTKLITANHIRSFIAFKKDQGMAESSLESYRLIYSSFFNWLFHEGLIERNPMINVGAIKVPKKIKKSFSDTDIELLKTKSKNPRDIALVTFLLSTACRIGEIINLNIDDVDFVNKECTVRGKGNKERKVYLDEVCVLFLKNYLLKRTDNNPALFVSLRYPHDRILEDAVRVSLRKLGANAEVDHVHPHKFRRTKATNLIKHGMPINEVATVLGHGKLDTTMEYIVMDDSTVKHDYHKFS